MTDTFYIYMFWILLGLILIDWLYNKYKYYRYYQLNKDKVGTFVSIGGVEWEAVNYGSSWWRPLGYCVEAKQWRKIRPTDGIRQFTEIKDWKQLIERTTQTFIPSKQYSLNIPLVVLTDKENGNTISLPLFRNNNGYYGSLTFAVNGFYYYFISENRFDIRTVEDNNSFSLSIRCVKKQ